MDEEIESRKAYSKEFITHTKIVWLFDVDGVITNPEKKTITEPTILDEIAKRLKIGEPVALVTGRSIDFIQERVIEPLVGKVKDPSLLHNFLAVGEKGGTWITYTETGKFQENIDENISVPQNLQEEVRSLIENKFSDLMFYDQSKKTMISTEMLDGKDLKEYRLRQKELTRKLKDILARQGLSLTFKIDPTTIAVDIQSMDVGKGSATRRVLNWLKKRKIKAKQFVAIGDSKSDIAIAQEVHDRGFPVLFVFVGKEKDQNDIQRLDLPFPVIFTHDSYEKGTKEYLKMIPKS